MLLKRIGTDGGDWREMARVAELVQFMPFAIWAC